jgi:hypothetical protein
VAAWRSKSGRIVIESFFRLDWFLFERTKLCRARRGRNLYQLELSLLQFSTEHGQMRRDSLRMVFGGVFILSIYCPFQTENWLYSVERIEAGETVDSKNRQ